MPTVRFLRTLTKSEVEIKLKKKHMLTRFSESAKSPLITALVQNKKMPT